MEKDAVERAAEPGLNLKAYLADAYLHPIFQSFEEVDVGDFKVDRHQAQQSLPVVESSPSRSQISSPSLPHYVYHFEIQP